jgi:colicin import membrane protein
MSDEELAIAKAAAELSSHFKGAMPAPKREDRGRIETRTSIRAFTTEESFDSAMEQHAFEGVEEAELAEYGLPVDAERSSKKKSKYASKKAKRLAEERRIEEERKREEERRKLRKESPVPPDARRAEFLREEARRRVQELRLMQEQASCIEEAVAAATPQDATKEPPLAMRPIVDLERFHRRSKFFGFHR